MQNIKHVGKSGQISLGKALAGKSFILEELPGGDIMLKRAAIISMPEVELPPDVAAEVEASRAWRREHPAQRTDLKALAADLGVADDDE